MHLGLVRILMACLRTPADAVIIKPPTARAPMTRSKVSLLSTLTESS